MSSNDIKLQIQADRKWRQCPLCRGRGLNPVLLTHCCPKCDGERRIPVQTAKPMQPLRSPWKDHIRNDNTMRMGPRGSTMAAYG